MADKNMNERLSALMDGEVDAKDMHETIREMRSESEMKRSWDHYHLIGDALRKNLPRHVDASFASRVSQVVAQEDLPAAVMPSPQTQVAKPITAKPVAGFALAASVAVVAYLGFGMIAVDEQTNPRVASTAPVVTPSTQVVASVPVQPVQPAAIQVVQGQRWSVAKPSVESKLNTYLYNHDNVLTNAGMNSRMVTHARLVVSSPGRGE